MTKLYSKLAIVYHEMYQSIFNYKKEFNFYNKILKKYKSKKILEIGCGSGNLAKFFLKAGYNYTGIDLSKEMLKIAKELEPTAKFMHGDMRDLKLKNNFDAILITGRSFTYMTTNEEVIQTFKSIHKILRNNGILVFDNFNAKSIFGNFRKQFIQFARYKNRKYKRVSETSFNLKTGWTWNWYETYYITENGKTKIIKDNDVLRAFTEDELSIFLKICNFGVLEFKNLDKFVFVTIARKI